MSATVYRDDFERADYQARARKMQRLIVAGGTAVESYMHYAVRLAEGTPGEPYHCGRAGCEVCEDAAVQLKAREREAGEEG